VKKITRKKETKIQIPIGPGQGNHNKDQTSPESDLKEYLQQPH
jgi:hypothetical protein